MIKKGSLLNFVKNNLTHYQDKLVQDLRDSEVYACVGEKSDISKDIHYDRVIIELLKEIEKICVNRGRF